MQSDPVEQGESVEATEAEAEVKEEPKVAAESKTVKRAARKKAEK